MHLPYTIRDLICKYFFDIHPDATIRVATCSECSMMEANPTGTLRYFDSAGVQHIMQPSHRTAIIASNRFIAQDATEWLARTQTLRVNTYDPHVFQHNQENFDNPFCYPPPAVRSTLSLVTYMSILNHLEIDSEFLIGIPDFVAHYCEDINLKSLKMSLRNFSKTKAGLGNYWTFKNIVIELEDLSFLCVKEEVCFEWAEIAKTFAGYPEADRQQYCKGFLEPVESLKDRMNRNWATRFESQRLIKPLGS